MKQTGRLFEAKACDSKDPFFRQHEQQASSVWVRTQFSHGARGKYNNFCEPEAGFESPPLAAMIIAAKIG